jgi:crotonobetainyl-CoA:carnitine CoA-transferase CaiB-like acyl-CoA transferase
MDVEIGGPASGPLAGIRVLDLSSVVSGPLCAQILGDLGADVIKIESPAGDVTRRLGPPFVAQMTPLFANCNRNKRALAVDLKSEEGQDVVRTLARDVDVLVENYRPGVADRLGLGYERLSQENPKLIYVSICGFGHDGPYRDLPAYDTVIQGLVGFMPTQGREGPPALIKSIVADKTTSITATYSLIAALFARERGDGSGQHVVVPMLDAYAAFMLPDVIGAETFPPAEPQGLPLDVHRTWETADGHVVMMIIEDKQFEGICRAVGLADMIDDPRCENLITRVMHAAELFGELEVAIKKFTTADLVARAREFGAPLAPANDLKSFLADPQVAHSRTVFEVQHPEAGTLRLLRNPARFGKTPSNVRQFPPGLGQHTDELLRESGYDEAAIAKLRASGAIA